ncbi:hypothetical protein C8R44DRAFT_854989 [Mycena epipterygia]|nr:hypothetical protein C8R44DRAFT_854989 [Mycena epipterygia]
MLIDMKFKIFKVGQEHEGHEERQEHDPDVGIGKEGAKGGCRGREHRPELQGRGRGATHKGKAGAWREGGDVAGKRRRRARKRRERDAERRERGAQLQRAGAWYAEGGDVARKGRAAGWRWPARTRARVREPVGGRLQSNHEAYGRSDMLSMGGRRCVGVALDDSPSAGRAQLLGANRAQRGQGAAER